MFKCSPPGSLPAIRVPDRVEIATTASTATIRSDFIVRPLLASGRGASWHMNMSIPGDAKADNVPFHLWPRPDPEPTKSHTTGPRCYEIWRPFQRVRSPPPLSTVRVNGAID